MSIGTQTEPWVLGKADSRFGCLPLPLNGYFSGFFRKCAEDADIPVADDNLLLCRSGVAFFPLADFDALNEQVQEQWRISAIAVYFVPAENLG